MLFETSIASTVPVLDDLPIFVNTNDFGPEDFQMFLECSNYINNSRSLQQKSGTSAVTSTKLHEELFEYNRRSGSREIIIDESFNVNSLSLSMKNLFQYFNEDVNVMSRRESLDSLSTSNRDLHRPVIVDASPKLAPTVRYRPKYIQNPHQKNKRYQKNTLKPDRNSFPFDNLVLKASNIKDDYRRRSLDALHKANNLEFYSFTQAHSRPVLDPGCSSDNDNNEKRNESENTISVKERVAFFNKLTESDSVDNEVPIVKKIEIPLEHVAVIKSKLYNSLSSAKVLATCEEPVLPEESVRSKIEKFENGQIRSPFQSRSTSQDTIKKDIISSTEELSSPLLVKSIRTRSKQDSLVKCEQYLHSAKPLRYVSPYSRYSKSPDSLDSGSSTLGADSPHSEPSSPSDYYSSSDGPRAVRYACPPYYSPSPPSLTPDSNDSEPKSNHPFIESGRNLRKLQDIARMIRNIRLQGFLDASQELFEQFLTMICACADICLVEGIRSCQGDLDEICSFLQPPENELQKSHDSSAALSEHQLRVQASLQRLNIPDWFRQYSSTPKTETGYRLSNFNRKRASESGRWAGLNSKTTSLSSLGSQRSDRSPLMLSPSAHSHHGGQTGFSRWSTSHLNSTQTSPSVSTRGSFSRGAIVNSSFISGHSVSGAVVRNSFRQPYLGWRSQEKLALSQPRTPHERLASSVLAQQQHQSHHQQSEQNQLGHEKTQQELPVTPEIQSSIKEVTSAIVHYVNDQTNRTSSRSRSTSPSSRKCWVESSFVGIKPVESPQTPIIDNSFNANAQQTASGQGTTRSTGATFAASTHSGASDILRMNGVVTADCTSPTAASLEDVLASLLGLPTDSYRSSGDTVNDFPAGTCLTSLSPSSLQVEQQNRLRRRSEGDAQRQQQQHQQQKQKLETIQQQNPSSSNQPSDMLPVQSPRRVSLDSSESKTASDLLVRCRNTKCDQVALASEAKKTYKSCHNCSHQYCSRDCRRTHWEKHRKACLHSRVSNLCRQVLSSCKDDTDTLRHLSLLARKGYFSQGRGVVRILFRCPEGAEAFIKNGFQCLGEASYVRWPDLMPAEMGLELYSELLRLSTEYKPDSKLLIYVAICVVSEAPGTGTAPVKWERQLVSRCAKLKLCKTILNEVDPAIQQNAPPQEPFTEILILTFNTQKKSSPKEREIISVNIQTLLTRRGVSLRKHYPEIYQRLQSYVEGVTDKFSPVTIHPRDSQTGQGFVCIIMPNTGDTELSRLPKSDTGNRVSTFDVGEELFES